MTQSQSLSTLIKEYFYISFFFYLFFCEYYFLKEELVSKVIIDCQHFRCDVGKPE